MSRKIIPVSVEDFSPREFEGTLTALKDRVQMWIDEYGPESYVDWDPDFYYEYEPNPSPRFNIMIQREETDQEYAIRTEKEEEAKALREKWDREQFEKLKKQFGEK